jgi:hypothetical protein
VLSGGAAKAARPGVVMSTLGTESDECNKKMYKSTADAKTPFAGKMRRSLVFDLTCLARLASTPSRQLCCIY